MSLAFLEMTVEKIPVVVPVYPLAMKIVITKTALINIFVCECEDTDAVLHAAAPISLVLRPRKEIVSTVAI